MRLCVALCWLACWLGPLPCSAQPQPSAADAFRFSPGVALGFAYFTRAESEVSDASSPSRDALRFTLPCQFSVGAVGLELSPGFAIGDLATLSAYVGPNFELPLGQLALRFGVGLWLGHNFSGGVYTDGNDIFGRIPITLGYRAGERFGVFATLALGLGASQVASRRCSASFNPRPHSMPRWACGYDSGNASSSSISCATLRTRGRSARSA